MQGHLLTPGVFAAQVTAALAVFPEHTDSLELKQQLRRQLNSL
jgi:hypothetical protein